MDETMFPAARKRPRAAAPSLNGELFAALEPSPEAAPAAPPAPKVALQWFDVPAGTESFPCRGCLAPVYWCHTVLGRAVPVSCAPTLPDAVAEAKAPTATAPGRGINHFQDCPAAAQFTRGARR